MYIISVMCIISIIQIIFLTIVVSYFSAFISNNLIIRFILLISLILIISFCRYDGISCTLWLGAEARMAVSMHLITARSRTGMLVHWVSMQSSLCCQTNSQGFCLSITLVDLKLWIFLQYRTTGASLMCMEHLRTIR